MHTDPHIVAAWDDDLLHSDVARPNDQGEDREIVLREIITQLDAPRRLRHKTVAAGHVLHVPISAHHDDGLLGDQPVSRPPRGPGHRRSSWVGQPQWPTAAWASTSEEWT
ncbi:hypothetical protein FHX81_4146 [Saccharothrix saharensis]|uniref:Uncharacterized protein n=1 Tax=Saccharothrix saharensis TaxID=571190 RepID=A0A543JG13_9PSEU|nr:hypothetical protein FHX81_4146 [Saccharothrix saharensis]